MLKSRMLDAISSLDIALNCSLVSIQDSMVSYDENELNSVMQGISKSTHAVGLMRAALVMNLPLSLNVSD